MRSALIRSHPRFPLCQEPTNNLTALVTFGSTGRAVGMVGFAGAAPRTNGFFMDERFFHDGWGVRGCPSAMPPG